LVAEILRLRHEQILTLLARTLADVQGQSFRAQAQACLSAIMQYFREHRRFFIMALESELGPACANKRLSQDTRGRIREAFRELIARGVRSGELRANAQELGAVLLAGMMRELIMSDVESEHSGTPQELVAQVLAIFIEGAGVKS
jgi:hypothetical protein